MAEMQILVKKPENKNCLGDIDVDVRIRTYIIKEQSARL
jgi:hypothetical protein